MIVKLSPADTRSYHNTFINLLKTKIMGFLGAPEIILILIAILILFGGKKIPELMKGLGKGMKEFKDSQNDEAPKVARVKSGTDES